MREMAFDPQTAIGYFVPELADSPHMGLYWLRHRLDDRTAAGEFTPLTSGRLLEPGVVLRLERERAIAGLRRVVSGYEARSRVLSHIVEGSSRDPRLEILRGDAHQFGLMAQRAREGLGRIFAAANAPWFRFLEEMGESTRRIDVLVALARLDLTHAAHSSAPLGTLYLNAELRDLALSMAGSAPTGPGAYRAYVRTRAAAGDRFFAGIRQYLAPELPFRVSQRLVPRLRRGEMGSNGLGTEMLQEMLRVCQGDLKKLGAVVWSRPKERRDSLVCAGGREVRAEKRLVTGALRMFDPSAGEMFPALEALRVAKGQSMRAHAARLAVASCGQRGGGPAYAALVQKLAGLGALGLLLYLGCSSERVG